MTRLQSIQMRQSETREAINVLLNTDDRSDEQNAELRTLTATMATAETEYRAALSAEGDTERETREAAQAAGVDPETREKLELRGRSSVGAFLLAALQGRVPSGAEAEYAAAHNAPAGEIPMDLWESGRPVETRAATPAPSTGAGVTVAPVQPFVFAPSIAPRLGIDMPSAPSGAYTEMTISTALPAAPKAKAADADDTAGALTAITASPRRISARMTVALEDVAAIGQANFEAALRQNVSMALSDAYDSQAITGNGTSPNVNGIIAQLTDPTNPSAIATFDDYVEAYADAVDGLWASSVEEVSMVANVAAYRLSAKTFRSAGDASITASAYLKATTGGWWTNSRMPATASTIARAIIYRMGRMGLRTACHPTWGTISIDDIYTDSVRAEKLHRPCDGRRQGAARPAGGVRDGRVQSSLGRSCCRCCCSRRVVVVVVVRTRFTFVGPPQAGPNRSGPRTRLWEMRLWPTT